jgi:uncharacterized secreted protein with C-terminal beta-propeller domain
MGGAHVFRVNLEKGFTAKGTVNQYLGTGRSYNGVTRALVIEDILYIVSTNEIVMRDGRTISAQVSRVELFLGSCNFFTGEQ